MLMHPKKPPNEVSSATARNDDASLTSLNLSAPNPILINTLNFKFGRLATVVTETQSSIGSPRPFSSPT